MLLPEEHGGVLRIVRNVVHAIAPEAMHVVILAQPCLAAVIAAEEPRGGNTDPHAVGIFRVGQNGVSAKSAEAWRPFLTPRLFVESVNRLPAFAAVAADEQAGFRNARIERAMRGMQRPDLIDKTAAAFQLAFK